MFHVEVRQHSEVIRALNLSEEELRAKLLAPLARGGPFTFADRQWDARDAKVTIVEGRELGAGELLLAGRGWSTAQKIGTDVTESMLEGVRAQARRRLLVERLTERILGRIAAGPLALGDAVDLLADLMAEEPSPERAQTVAQAAWEMLHRRQAVLLDGAGAPVEREDWQPVLLAWSSRAEDQATASEISLARSASDANR